LHRLALLFVPLVLTSHQVWGQPNATYRDSRAPIDLRVRDLVGRMTLDEKVDQMTGSGLAPFVLSMLLRDELAVVYAGANERLGIPPVAFTDGPRGVIVGRSTSFPVAIARAASWDLDLQRRVGDAIGQEARAQGANYWGGLTTEQGTQQSSEHPFELERIRIRNTTMPDDLIRYMEADW
jgi:hypothetical protein